MTGDSDTSIIVFGATGTTGREVVQQALERGMRVTAFVRDAQKLALEHDRLTVVQGDVLDRPRIDAAMSSGAAAAISTLGVFSRKPTTELSTGTRNIVESLHDNGISRFIVVSSLGVGDSKGQGNWAARAWQRFMIPRVLEDKERQEDIIRNSGLNWTLYRPARILIDSSIHGDVVEWSGPPPAQALSWSLTAGTLAGIVLDALNKPATKGRAICLSRAG
jgi:putative NADH-flavin reductase